MSLNGTIWAPTGPSPIDPGAITANGQVTAIAVNPNNPNIIYIGTAWGGGLAYAGRRHDLDTAVRSGAGARRWRTRSRGRCFCPSKRCRPPPTLTGSASAALRIDLNGLQSI